MTTEYVIVEEKNNRILVSTQINNANSIALTDQRPQSISIVTSTPIIPTGVYALINHSHVSSQISDLISTILNTVPVFNLLSTDSISINSSNRIFTSTLSLPSVSCGRLTLTSNDPIGLSDTTNSIIYYTPYNGNMISLYDTTDNIWKIYKFNQISLTLDSLTIDKNYDIFIYYNNGLILEKVSWDTNTSRSINLIYQDGILVKDSEPNKKYLGTFRAISSNSTTDTVSQRFVFNFYNKIDKILQCSDNTIHTYATSSIRPYRNITTVGNTRLEFIQGYNNDLLTIICGSSFVTENDGSLVAVAIDSVLSINTNCINSTYISGPSPLNLSDSSIDKLQVTSGYHYLQLLQSGSSVSTFNSAFMKVIILC